MAKIWSRILAAAALSLSVFGATHYFAIKVRPNSQVQVLDKPIAYIKDLNDQVEKRSVSSLVWKSVFQGEPLHPGEAVKTSVQGEVRIQFADSSRFLDLDPDSLIVLNLEKGNEIALDLMSGSLFVGRSESAAASGEPALTLKSGEGKVDLSEATAQLSKGAGHQIDVQVIKGKAKVENNGQVKELSQSRELSGLEIILPKRDRPTLINGSLPEPVRFEWRGFPEGLKTSLWIGRSQKTMKEASSTDTSGKNFLFIKLKAGSYVWKLVGKDPTGEQPPQESSLYRLKVENRYPPTPISPTHESKLSDNQVPFQWHSPEKATSVTVEVAKDASLSENIHRENFTSKFSFTKELAPGIYFWRLSASYPDMEKSVSSQIFTFSVGLPAEKPKPHVILSWIEGLTSPQLFIETPKADLAWTTEQKDQVHIYRLKLAETEEALKDPKATPLFQSELSETQTQAPLPKPGRYVAMVEALNEKNEVLATTVTRTFDVLPRPLLPAPEFEPLIGDFKTDPQGRLNLRWTQIPEAKEYWLSLMDSEGREIRKARFERSSTSLANLLPGRYLVSIVAIDTFGRSSGKKPPRPVLVPDNSGLQAPKLKKILVK